MIILLIAIIAFTAMGCTAILEVERVTERPHVREPVGRPPDEQIEVSNFEELKEAITELVEAHELVGRLISFAYEYEELQEELDRAIHEILTYHPIGVYAVSEITAHATKIVAFFEINIAIEYIRTRQQMDSIVNVSTMPALREQLLGVMSEYQYEAVFRTNLQITVDQIFGEIIDIYYQNPSSFFWNPIIAVEMFPETGEDRIFSISFDFGRSPGLLISLVQGLQSQIQSTIEEAAHGETDAEIMLSLVRHLVSVVNFNENVARTVAAHGMQNHAGTAFGALVNNDAIGEGFAMAFKALSDELGLESRVILGTLDGRYHAWNIVRIDGNYYHIDVSMGYIEGIENIFLKTDIQMRNLGYDWDFISTPRAQGVLTYEYVVGPEEYDYPEEYDDIEDANNGPAVRPPQPGVGREPDPAAPDPGQGAYNGATEPELPDEPYYEIDEPDYPEDPDDDQPDETQDPDDSEISEEDEQSEE